MKLFFASLLFANCLSAASINIAFHNGGTTVGAMTSRPDGTLVQTSVDTWNNPANNGAQGLNFSGFALLDSAGGASGAELSAAAGFATFNNNGWGSNTQDHVMMEGWYGLRDSESITISNLPAADGNGYTVTIFGDPGANRDMFYAINGSSQLQIARTAAFGGSFTSGSEFVTFSNVTGSNTLSILGNQGAQAGRAAVNGIIIDYTPIPEPSVALLGVFGLFALAARRR